MDSVPSPPSLTNYQVSRVSPTIGREGREEDVQRSFQGIHLYFRRFNEEVICASALNEAGLSCEGVTSAVYMTETELNRPADLEYAILRGLDIAAVPDNLPGNPAIRLAPTWTP